MVVCVQSLKVLLAAYCMPDSRLCRYALTGRSTTVLLALAACSTY